MVDQQTQYYPKKPKKLKAKKNMLLSTLNDREQFF
jgi:hypothetical protein